MKAAMPKMSMVVPMSSHAIVLLFRVEVSCEASSNDMTKTK